ncbi:recombinase family protein [Pseudocitrobacter sp. 73]|uniref:recombinase family protein n=1 Tax=Pseudocitrobacter sp. 73 TaxID=2605731 RepID=UPI0011EFFB4A|nr:recombinase family protein [Pseudocitrobacter sp. 73]KAA1051816.1 resolvase [Pseudocitrobacter sp. 73]
MTKRVYAYLRASTKEQDANRAKIELQSFADKMSISIAAWFVENESGASLSRPELFKLIDVAQPGDVLLVEQVDRLSRLNGEDWEKLSMFIKSKGIRVVALDLPTSHMMIQIADDFTNRMMDALNGMMLDMLAAIARKDYTDRRRRQAQGIAKAKSEGKFRGRQADLELHRRIIKLREAGMSYTDIQQTTGVARTTISRVLKAQ